MAKYKGVFDVRKVEVNFFEKNSQDDSEIDVLILLSSSVTECNKKLIDLDKWDVIIDKGGLELLLIDKLNEVSLGFNKSVVQWVRFRILNGSVKLKN